MNMEMEINRNKRKDEASVEGYVGLGFGGVFLRETVVFEKFVRNLMRNIHNLRSHTKTQF